MTALPAGFRELRRFRTVTPGEFLRCFVEVDPSSPDHALRSNVYFVDSQGWLVLSVEGLESIASRALNRLAAEPRADAAGKLVDAS